jgi:hypothetical protein
MEKKVLLVILLLSESLSMAENELSNNYSNSSRLRFYSPVGSNNESIGGSSNAAEGKVPTGLLVP